MKAIFAMLALTGILVTTPAYAFRCPADMAKIDKALQAGTSLSAAQLTEVQSLREKGEQLHKAGDHAGSVKALGKAMEMLGVN